VHCGIVESIPHTTLLCDHQLWQTQTLNALTHHRPQHLHIHGSVARMADESTNAKTVADHHSASMVDESTNAKTVADHHSASMVDESSDAKTVADLQSASMAD
jgi:hypothetical protein